ncbi:MAG: CBS domain-containing protein [Oscillospiraceae bacterium]|jgi:CBS domain-containing protein|nr:CBS domain-containing protein [Oscillospiraceae bacterium]MBQ4311993.1 CBS domain-containing protein [Oscillospiraceae bacterium]MCR5168810.1 CBS domain-containing protein [Oscillospiraceae bacterium]
MNIFNLLKMKSEVAFLYETITVREAVERFNDHGYTAVPVLSTEGAYVETITEGDFLRYMIAGKISGDMKEMENDILISIPVKRDIRAVHVDSKLDDLVELCKTQNFVPVVDDRGIFIGIVTRKDLICYALDRYNLLKKETMNK